MNNYAEISIFIQVLIYADFQKSITDTLKESVTSDYLVALKMFYKCLLL